MIKKICLTCGKEFLVKPYKIKIGEGKYCSSKCYWNSLRGKPTWNKGIGKLLLCPICKKEFYLPKNKIKKTNYCSSKCYHISTIGKPSWNKGKRGLQSGEKSGNWKGGITPINKTIRNSIDFRLWREAVFARDNWTCQKTGIRGGRLHAHHIKNFAKYPELRFAIDNGITFSKETHREFHKKYGIKNNNDEQLEEFLNNL